MGSEEKATDQQPMNRKRKRRSPIEMEGVETLAQIRQRQLNMKNKVESVCKVCGKLFQWKQSLKQHMKIRHGSKEEEVREAPKTRRSILENLLSPQSPGDSSGSLMGFTKTL